jgi:predicted TIM-barrel fold metal-dependent hydrolase
MIIDTHVAGVSRSPRDQKMAELVQKDKFMQFVWKLYGSRGHGGNMQMLSTIEDYLQAMESISVEKLIIHSVGYYPETCKALNDATKSLCEKYAEQLVGLATVPLAYPKKSVPELDRAIKDLGLKGLKIYPKFQGVTLDSRKMIPVYKKAEKLGIPILTHSDSYTGSYTGYGLKEVDNTACNTARLFTSGILKDTPNLKIILAHLGGGIMFYKDHLYAMSRFLQKPGEENLEAYYDRLFNQLYYDLAPAHWYSEKTVQMAIDIVGEDRIFFATDFPLVQGLEGVKRSIAHVKSFNLPESIKEKILGLNAKKFFNLK